MRIFVCMKTRLNLTIEDSLLFKIKSYAAQKQVSVSELVEDYFNNLTKPKPKKMNLIEFVKSMPKVELPYDDNVDLKKQYYEEKASKYGF